MTNINKAIERCLELDEKAVAGPWDSDSCGDVWSKQEWEECEFESGEKVWKSVGSTAIFRASHATQELIAEYRTLAPRLARALKIAMEALDKIYKLDEMSSDPYPTEVAPDFAKDALSQIAKVFE
jgi:hypothetical protein